MIYCLEKCIFIDGSIKFLSRLLLVQVLHSRDNVADFRYSSKIGGIKLPMEDGIAIVVIVKGPDFFSEWTFHQWCLSGLTVVELTFICKDLI